MSPSLKKPQPIVQRGSYGPSPGSRATFIMLRALDLPLQYAILSSRGLGNPIISALGGTPIPPTGRPLFLGGTNIGLSPLRSILFGMAIGSFVKHTYWVTSISQESFTFSAAVVIGVGNALADGLNALLFNNAATSVLSYVNGDETRLPTPALVGIGLYVLGMALEWGSEMQRLSFKKDVRNKGEVYDGGLFGLARHVNYGGFTLWRAGYAMAGGGWIAGAASAAFSLWIFMTKGIPELNDYCEKKVSCVLRILFALTWSLIVLLCF